jgi:hypothetical protein
MEFINADKLRLKLACGCEVVVTKRRRFFRTKLHAAMWYCGSHHIVVHSYQAPREVVWEQEGL